MAHHEKGQVSNLSFFVVHHPSELVTRQTSLPSFVNLRSKFLPRASIAKGYGKRQYSVLLQDTEVYRGLPHAGYGNIPYFFRMRKFTVGLPLAGNGNIPYFFRIRKFAVDSRLRDTAIFLMAHQN